MTDELAETALAPGNRDGVVCLTAPEAVTTPAELRRPDGLSRYTPAETERYATQAHLGREARVVKAAQGASGPAVPAAVVKEVIRSKPLNTAQAAAVRDMATSGRQVEVLIGPAGTGKSYTMAALTEVWERSGGTVIGLAASQRAADVLREEGVDHVENLSKLILENRRIAEGEHVPNADQYRIQPGQLVIVDEAGMASTDQIDQVRTLVEQAGAKMLTAGDYQQTAAVGAGGMLRLLAVDLDQVHVLEEVKRFSAAWEREASLALRDGDAAVLGDYDRHGRLREGSREAMTSRAYEGWLADHLAGRRSLLVASVNDQASELAARARGDLVRYGRVEPGGVRLKDKNLAGVGDQIQLRKNNRKLISNDGRHWAINRDVVTVTARGADGSLTVAYDDGARLRLPADYVADHVELAYAGTVHAAQGRTVDTSHALVDDRFSREQLYVALSRGKSANLAYTITDPAGSELGNPYVQEGRDRFAVLADVLGRTGGEDAATAVLRSELERAQHLGVLVPVWSDLLAEDAARRFGGVLQNTLGEDTYTRLTGEEAYASLIRLARHAEERGHDAAALLTQAATSRGLGDAESIGSVLHWRFERQIEHADTAAEQTPGEDGKAIRHSPAETTGGLRGYADRTPPMDGPVGEYVRHLAEVMDARVAELGELAAAQAPVWALDRLGPVPEDPIEREEWIRRAGAVAAYREAHGYTVDHDAIGAAPTRGAVDARGAWEQAYQALGAPEDAIDYAQAADARLREFTARHERELAWAPPYAEAELQDASLAAEDYRVQAQRAQAEAQTALDTHTRDDLETRAAEYTQLAELHATRVGKLEPVVSTYDRWHAHTEQVRQAAQQARAELDRRHPAHADQLAAELAPRWDRGAVQTERIRDLPELETRQEHEADYARTHPAENQLTIDDHADPMPAAETLTGYRMHAERAQADAQAAVEAAARIEAEAAPQREQAPEPGEQMELDLDLPEKAPEPRMTAAQIDQAVHAAQNAARILEARAAEATQATAQTAELADQQRRLEYHRQQQIEQQRRIALERNTPHITR